MHKKFFWLLTLCGIAALNISIPNGARGGIGHLCDEIEARFPNVTKARALGERFQKLERGKKLIVRDKFLEIIHHHIEECQASIRLNQLLVESSGDPLGLLDKEIGYAIAGERCGWRCKQAIEATQREDVQKIVSQYNTIDEVNGSLTGLQYALGSEGLDDADL